MSWFTRLFGRRRSRRRDRYEHRYENRAPDHRSIEPARPGEPEGFGISGTLTAALDRLERAVERIDQVFIAGTGKTTHFTSSTRQHRQDFETSGTTAHDSERIDRELRSPKKRTTELESRPPAKAPLEASTAPQRSVEPTRTRRTDSADVPRDHREKSDKPRFATDQPAARGDDYGPPDEQRAASTGPVSQGKEVAQATQFPADPTDQSTILRTFLLEPTMQILDKIRREESLVRPGDVDRLKNAIFDMFNQFYERDRKKWREFVRAAAEYSGGKLEIKVPQRGEPEPADFKIISSKEGPATTSRGGSKQPRTVSKVMEPRTIYNVRGKWEKIAQGSVRVR